MGRLASTCHSSPLWLPVTPSSRSHYCALFYLVWRRFGECLGALIVIRINSALHEFRNFVIRLILFADSFMLIRSQLGFWDSSFYIFVYDCSHFRCTFSFTIRGWGFTSIAHKSVTRHRIVTGIGALGSSECWVPGHVFVLSLGLFLRFPKIVSGTPGFWAPFLLFAPALFLGDHIGPHGDDWQLGL